MKIFFSGIRFYICPDIPEGIIRGFFNSRFSSRKSQSQQRLAKNITHFTIQSCSKTSLILQTSTQLTLKVICFRNTAKTFLTLQIFQQTCFSLVSEKIFALHHFLTPKNSTAEALWRQMSVYFYTLLKMIFLSKTWSLLTFGRLNDSLKAARCLGLLKCFTIFHFNWNFWKFNYYLAFRYFYL